MGESRRRRRGQWGEDGGSNDSGGDRTQEFVVVVIRSRSPCTLARGIATCLSLDLNEAAVLGVIHNDTPECQVLWEMATESVFELADKLDDSNNKK